ncbi:Coactosin [Vanrija pseudolonga]|uniref:Coactosin n=1 Tax=Vanrija pseudolonga TaxID=143232 RepID=A0AAF1BLL9_9TREE|nr:Coactosin [Vanrija pseudolonga]
MADVKDPKIAEAYELVRSDKSDETWLRLDYESDKSDKLVLSETGTGDLDEFTSKLDPAKASFGFVRVKYANDEHSFREKFTLVTWIGENVKIMRRAKVSVHTADVKSIIRSYSIEVSASTPKDLEVDEVVQRLRRAGGANYDRSKFD